VHLDLNLLREKRNILPAPDVGERTKYKPAYSECKCETTSVVSSSTR